MACRSINSGLFLSHGIRQGAHVSVVLQGQKANPTDPDVVVEWAGSDLIGLWPDDKSIATKLQRAICHAFDMPCPAVGQKRTATETPQSVTGVTATRSHFGDFLKTQIKPGSHGIYLHEEGVPVYEYLRTVGMKEEEVNDFVIVVGGPNGLTAEEESVVSRLNLTKICFPGPSLFASHCLVLANHYLDIWCMENNIPIPTEPEKKK